MVPHDPQSVFGNRYGKLLLAGRIPGKDVRLIYRFAIDQKAPVCTAALDGVSAYANDALDVLVVAAGEAERVEQIIGEAGFRVRQEGSTAVKYDDVPALRCAFGVGPAVHCDALARVERGFHGVRFDMEDVHHRGADQDGGQQAQNDGEYSEAPDP